MKKIVANIEAVAALSILTLSVVALKFVIYAPELTNNVVTSVLG